MLEKSSSRFFCFFKSTCGSMATAGLPPLCDAAATYSLPCGFALVLFFEFISGEQFFRDLVLPAGWSTLLREKQFWTSERTLEVDGFVFRIASLGMTKLFRYEAGRKSAVAGFSLTMGTLLLAFGGRWCRCEWALLPAPPVPSAASTLESIICCIFSYFISSSFSIFRLWILSRMAFSVSFCRLLAFFTLVLSVLFGLWAFSSYCAFCRSTLSCFDSFVCRLDGLFMVWLKLLFFRLLCALWRL